MAESWNGIKKLAAAIAINAAATAAEVPRAHSQESPAVVSDSKDAQADRWYLLADSPADDTELSELGQKITELMVAAEQDKLAAGIQAEYMEKFQANGLRRIKARFPFPHQHYVEIFTHVDKNGSSNGRLQITGHDKLPGHPFDVVFEPDRLGGYLRRGTFSELRISESSSLYSENYADAGMDGTGDIRFADEERVFLRRLAKGILQHILMRN